MCGRYRLTAKDRAIAKHFELDEAEVLWKARYNIAPTQEVAVVRQDPKRPQRKFSVMRWGLIPYWAKDPSIGYKTINGMAETAAEKPAFREAMKRRRCLVPADGFYEWRQSGGKKQPYHIRPRDGKPLAFAGLWEHWHRGDEVIDSCTVLTTQANATVLPMHDRMPLIVDPRDYDLWLVAKTSQAGNVLDLLGPCPSEVLTAIAGVEWARKEVETSAANVKLSREEVQLTRQRFTQGITDNTEVVNAQDRVSKADDARVRAMYTLGLARANLARATGAAEKTYRK